MTGGEQGIERGFVSEHSAMHAETQTCPALVLTGGLQRDGLQHPRALARSTFAAFKLPASCVARTRTILEFHAVDACRHELLLLLRVCMMLRWCYVVALSCLCVVCLCACVKMGVCDAPRGQTHSRGA